MFEATIIRDQKSLSYFFISEFSISRD